MSSVSDAVQTAVEADVFLREALARGIVNHQALAVWLQRHRGIGGTVDAVAKATRRYEEMAGPDPHLLAWRALPGAVIWRKGPVQAFFVRRDSMAQEALPQLFLGIPGWQSEIRLVTTGRTMLVLVPLGKAQTVRAALGDPNILSMKDGLVEVSVEPKGRGLPVAAMMGLLLGALVARGVHVHHAMTGASQLIFVVSSEAETDAFDVLATVVAAADGERSADPA